MRYLLQYTGKQIDALLDKVNSGSVIESVEKTDDGYDVTLTDGTVISLKNGDKGEQGEQGIQGPQGPKGETGVSITDITQTVISTDDEGINVVTVTKSDGDSQSFQVRNGSKGSTGAKGFSPIVKIADIDGGHRITITDATSVQSFDVLDGKDSESTVFDTAMSDSSENAVQNRVIKAYVDDAVANVEIDVDSAMSDSSTNPVQNKVVKAELDKKVDAVSGKQLSTEDFTSALKTKLEGLSNYDDTEISNAVDGLQTQIDTLVSGDASTAIESFNEIVAFLSGLDDTESLESIIASIEQQIAGKQELLVSGTNIKTINGESILGEGDIELDLSAYATKDEVIENEEVTAAAINDLKDRLGDFSADILDDYATKDDLQNEISSLTDEVVANKEVTDAAINDLKDKFGDYATKEELNTEIAELNTDIAELTEEVVLNEEITAAAINDLNDRVNDVYPNVAEIYSTKTEMASGFTELTEEVVTNEEVTAAALNDLNDRVSSCATLSDLDSKQDILVSGSTIKTVNGNSLLGSGDITIEGGGGGDLMTEIAYADLVALRDAGNLVAGMKYRITDYETKTSKINSQSAGHPFDIIVTALDGSTLDEKASAIQSARDTDGYFANSKLEAWEVWYCLDNDTDRFDWAVKAGSFLIVDLSEMGAGSVQAIPNGTFEYEGTAYYRWDVTVMGTAIYVLTVNASPAVGESTMIYMVDYSIVVSNAPVVSLTESTDNGFGVVYRLIDDKGNDVPYDFKNIQFVRKITDGELDLENGVDTFCYTFSDFSTGLLLDASENLSTIIYNKFEQFCWDNVLIGTMASYNTFGGNCQANTFGGLAVTNTFGAACHSNTFEDGCDSNTFGDNCYNNTFRDLCCSNIFGNNCYANIFGNNCDSNTFGNGCVGNIFGEDCDSNTFGDSCYNNTFGNGCIYNTFGNKCQFNTFGQGCSYNTFGNNCYTNTFATASDGSAIADSCYYNTLGQHCNYNIIWNASGSIQNIEIKPNISGTRTAKQAIEIPVSNAFYVQTVAKNSSGVIKIYCEADLIA